MAGEIAVISTHDPPETTVLDSEDASEDADGVWVSVWVSVAFAVSSGVVVVSAVLVSAGAACSLVVVCAGPASVDPFVVVAACGDCAGALRAFVEPVELVACFLAERSPAREDLSFVPAPFVAALAVLPGKAWAASSVKTPVSVAEPASSQRLHCFRRLRAASRECVVGEVLIGTYSTP
jgi:hypothetical protein